MLKHKRAKIGIIGCGAIGREVALFIDRNLGDYAYVCAVADKDSKAAGRLKKDIRSNPKNLGIEELIVSADLIIESASVEAAKIVLKLAGKYRKDIIILSVGALISSGSLLRSLLRRKINIYIPSGAIGGVDALGALRFGSIKSICITTSKPPAGLIGADYLKKKNINLKNQKSSKIIFKGSADKAIKYFPKNINVAATLLMASSFKGVKVCIKAEPKIKRNIHSIAIEAKEAKIKVIIENVPSKSNPKTSVLTILSTQHLLTKIFCPLKIGS